MSKLLEISLKHTHPRPVRLRPETALLQEVFEERLRAILRSPRAGRMDALGGTRGAEPVTWGCERMVHAIENPSRLAAYLIG